MGKENEVKENSEFKKEIIKEEPEEVEELDLGVEPKPKVDNSDINTSLGEIPNQMENNDNLIDNNELVPEEKQKKGSKFLVIFLVIIVLIALGGVMYYFWNRENNEELEKVITEPAKDYFEKYVSANVNPSGYKITLAMLQQANENGEKYDLSALSKCDPKTTSVTVKINYENGEIKETKAKLNCGI